MIEWWEREIWWERGEDGKGKGGELGGNQAEVDSREVVKLTTAANTTQKHVFGILHESARRLEADCLASLVYFVKNRPSNQLCTVQNILHISIKSIKKLLIFMGASLRYAFAFADYYY